MKTRPQTLPKSATYHEQKDFVEGLPRVTEDTPLTRAVFTVKYKKNPLDVQPAEIDSNVKLEVFHHAVTNQVTNAANSDTDNDNDEGQETTAVITRRLLIAGNEKHEKMELHLPDKKNENLTTFTVKINADGSVSVRKKDVPMAAVTQDLLLADGSKKAGVVVEATSATNASEGGRYLAYSLNNANGNTPKKPDASSNSMLAANPSKSFHK